MNDVSNSHDLLPKPGALRWQIAIALLLKIVLLTGLWFLLFRWPDRPPDKPDIAELFAPPVHTDFSSQSEKESHHVR